MGMTFKPLPVKLVVGLIAQDQEILNQSLSFLSRKFGPADLQSPLFSFDQTDYYEKEMGKDLQRGFFSFKRLIDPERLISIKIHTNSLERKFLREGRRRVNIDPGYVSLSKLVLATTKSFVHRLLISKGIFEEITLYYKGNSFEPGAWTYPDYRCRETIAFFNDVRSRYYEQLERAYGRSQLFRCV